MVMVLARDGDSDGEGVIIRSPSEPGSMLSTFHMLNHFLLTTLRRWYHYHPHFRNKQSEAQISLVDNIRNAHYI